MPAAPTVPIVRRIYFGGDPGAGGGLACIAVREGGGRLSEAEVEATTMPPTRADVMAWIAEQLDLHPTAAALAVVEKVGGYVRGGATDASGGRSKGGGAANGSAMFKFGMSYERVLFAFHAAKVPADEVGAAVWQRAVGVTPRGKGETKTAFKNRLKARAQQLFPGLKVTLATADALLIAHYCRRARGDSAAVRSMPRHAVGGGIDANREQG